MLLAIAYLLSGGVEEQNSFAPPGFIDGKWWSYNPGQFDLKLQVPSPGSCADDMIKISGNMLDDGEKPGWMSTSIESVQKNSCTDWIEKKFPERCKSFDREKWLEDSKLFSKKYREFCIDKYEWPNQKGNYPWVMVTFPEAQSLCESAGKRLCTEDEWTFACEGEEATPYPYGYSRNSEECGIDKQWRKYSQKALTLRGDSACSKELQRLWNGSRSGDHLSCVSSYGVEDMTGNVDEWTVRVRPGEYSSILKGGYWGPVRNRCRPSTRNHAPGHTFYQQGFRCCSNLK